MPDPFREIEGHREHGQDGDQPALMPRMSDLSSLKCTRAVNMGTGDFGTSISCDPRGLGTQGTTADRKMNAAVRFDCPAWSGRDRCGGRPLLTTQSESWRLHRVAHRPGPGRSEQVRRSGPGPTLSSSLRPPQKNTTAARAKRIVPSKLGRRPRRAIDLTQAFISSAVYGCSCVSTIIETKTINAAANRKYIVFIAPPEGT
jgi:hypothetical protein